MHPARFLSLIDCFGGFERECKASSPFATIHDHGGAEEELCDLWTITQTMGSFFHRLPFGHSLAELLNGPSISSRSRRGINRGCNKRAQEPLDNRPIMVTRRKEEEQKTHIIHRFIMSTTSGQQRSAYFFGRPDEKKL